MDIAHCGGKPFLITVDCYTDWPAINGLQDISTKSITGELIGTFLRSGVPDVIWSDCGRQFESAKFKKFCHDWNIIHKTSSPYYPQSNGKAEITVKAMKKFFTQQLTRAKLIGPR